MDLAAPQSSSHDGTLSGRCSQQVAADTSTTPNVCCLEKKNAPRLSNLKGGSEHGVVWLSAPAHARRDAQAIVTGARLTDPGRC